MSKHWSNNYIKFISIKIEYEDESAQWWDYDAVQYETLEDYKNDIANDFETIEEQYQDIELLVKGTDKQQYLFNIDRDDTSGMYFAELVLDYAEAMLNGN